MPATTNIITTVSTNDLLNFIRETVPSSHQQDALNFLHYIGVTVLKIEFRAIG